MKQVFIIESEVLVARAIERILTHNSYEVIGIATTYLQAEERLENLKPDLVFWDIDINDDFIDLNHIPLINSANKIPVVFLLSNGNREYLRLLDISYPFSYLTKPFSDLQLLEIVDKALFKKQLIV